MKDTRPKYKLSQIFENGNEGEAKLYRIDEIHEDFSLNRRGFLTTTALTAGTLLLAGCGNNPAVRVVSSDVPTSFSCPDFAHAHRSMIDAIAFSPDGTKLASSGQDKRLKIWDIPSGALYHGLTITESVKALAFSHDGLFLYGGGTNNMFYKWSVSEKKLIKNLKGHAAPVTAVGTTSMHNVLVSVGEDKMLKYWNTVDMKEMVSVGAHIEAITCLSVAPEGSVAATGSEGSSIKLWDIPSGHFVDELIIHKGSISTVALSPDGGFLVSLDSQGNLYITDTATREILQELSVKKGLTKIALSRDGALLFIQEKKTGRFSAKDSESRIWDIYEGQWISSISDDLGSYSRFDLSSDQKLLAAAGFQSIGLWEIPSLKNLTCLFDKAAVDKGKEGITYTYTDQYGRIITYVLPCGSPIPAGAVCTCNCVAGSYTRPVATGRTRTTGRTVCTCNKICTCVPIK